MILIILAIVALLFPSPIIIWNALKKHVIKQYSKGEFIISILTSVIPIWNHATFLYILFEYSDWDDDFRRRLKHVNEALVCRECGITSRRYQLTNNTSSECPHCHLTKGFHGVEVSKEYPFAPKINSIDFIKWKLEKNKLDNIQKDLKETERIDKELEAYEQLQLKKLQELEIKANEIKAELAQKGAS